MIKVKAKRRTLTRERAFSIPLESTAVLVIVVMITVFIAATLIFLGMRSLKLKEENRWISERIEQKRIEVQRLKDDVSELLSNFELVRIDER